MNDLERQQLTRLCERISFSEVLRSLAKIASHNADQEMDSAMQDINAERRARRYYRTTEWLHECANLLDFKNHPVGVGDDG